jgi:hypothetical protein
MIHVIAKSFNTIKENNTKKLKGVTISKQLSDIYIIIFAFDCFVIIFFKLGDVGDMYFISL